jgi:hypothetical protein
MAEEVAQGMRILEGGNYWCPRCDRFHKKEIILFSIYLKARKLFQKREDEKNL